MRCETLHLKDSFSFLGENGADPLVDLYLPYNMTEMNREHQKRPCLIVCPGGGYSICSQREAEPIALSFLPEGFNVFVLTYSVEPYRFPSQLREVAAVVELIHRHAEAWNCDTDKIAIIGFSAGGHLAAHYSNAYACDEVRAVFPDSKPVNATVLSYPVITADPAVAHKGSFACLLGRAPRDEAEEQSLSCDCLVTEHTPPAFIWHTASDTCVPVANSLRYAQALTAHRIPVELHIYPYGWHGLSTADRTTVDNVTPEVAYASSWLPRAKDWLKLMGF